MIPINLHSSIDSTYVLWVIQIVNKMYIYPVMYKFRWNIGMGWCTKTSNQSNSYLLSLCKCILSIIPAVWRKDWSAYKMNSSGILLCFTRLANLPCNDSSDGMCGPNRLIFGINFLETSNVHVGWYVCFSEYFCPVPADLQFNFMFQEFSPSTAYSMSLSKEFLEQCQWSLEVKFVKVVAYL
jgi:hypothetical protein